jgi:zinc protease
MSFKKLGATLVAGLICIAAQAAELTPVRTLGGISEYQLDNGLQLLLMPVPGAGRTFVTVTYKVGSRMEGPQEAGMAHLLEHVTFRGTRDPQGAFIDLGAEIKKVAPSSNGTTDFDHTNYTEDFVADPSVLSRVLALEAGRMVNSRLAEEDFEKEKPIVLNEMGMRGAVLGQQLLEGLEQGGFARHPYRRPVIGYTEDIEKLSLPVLRSFYEKFYRPDNAVLMIAGEFEVPQALAAVQASFGTLARPAGPVPEFSNIEPAQTAPRVVTLHTTQTGVAVGYHAPGLADAHAAALMVFNQMMPAIRSELTNDRSGMGAPVNFWQPTRDPFLLATGLPLPKSKSGDAEAREALAKQAEGWAEAMERGQFAGLNDRRNLTVAIERARSQMSQVLHAPGPASVMISRAVGAGDWRLAFKLLDELNGLQADDVSSAAEAYVRAINRVVVLGVTDPAIVGSRVEEHPLSGIASWFAKPVNVATVKDAAGAVGELKTPQVQQGATAGTAFEMDPAALDRETRRLQLPSGILLATLNRQSPDARVTVLLHFRWGSPQAMATEQGWRMLGLDLFSAGTDGATRLDETQISFLKAKLQAELGILVGPQGLDASLNVPSQHLIMALHLLRDLLRAPDLPVQSFQNLKLRSLTRLSSDPHGPDWAPELARRHRMQARGLQWGDPGYVPSPGELADILKKLDIDAVRAYWRRYGSANEARISAVGPLPESFLTAVETYFGDWKKPEAPPFERYVPGFKPEEGVRFVSSRKAAHPGEDDAHASANLQCAQGFEMNALDEDAVAMTIGARILAGGQVSGSRLTDRLRGRDAISYSVGYGLSLPQFGNAASLSLSATASPANALRAETAIREELARLLKDGITQAELDEARRQFMETRRSRFSSDGALAGALMQQLDRRESFAQADARQLTALEGLTVERVNAVLRRTLLPERWVMVITGAEPAPAQLQ